MATTPGTFAQHPLGNRPPGWKSHRNHYVILSYGVDANGTLVFTYKEGFTPARSQLIKSFSEFAMLPLSERGYVLDLEVFDDCYLEVWLNPLQSWQWSRKLDAITTKEDYSDFYFELRYGDGIDFYEREKFPLDKVPHIARFGAIHNKAAPAGTTHGFSMNIDLLYPTDDPLPITIDPDLQNPKT